MMGPRMCFRPKQPNRADTPSYPMDRPPSSIDGCARLSPSPPFFFHSPSAAACENRHPLPIGINRCLHGARLSPLSDEENSERRGSVVRRPSGAGGALAARSRPGADPRIENGVRASENPSACVHTRSVLRSRGLAFVLSRAGRGRCGCCCGGGLAISDRVYLIPLWEGPQHGLTSKTRPYPTRIHTHAQALGRQGQGGP